MHLWLHGPADAETALQRDGLDLSIQLLTADTPAAGLRTRAVFHERFVCVYRRDHPPASAPLTPALFARARHGLVALPGVVDTALAAVGPFRRAALIVLSFLVVPHLVAATDLVVTLPSRLACLRVAAPRCVVERPLALPGFAMSWSGTNANRGTQGTVGYGTGLVG